MELPNNSVGITDILTWRECPRKFSFGLKRHTGVAEQSEPGDERMVHGALWARAYGSAIHDSIEAIEKGFDEEAAIAIAWDRSGWALDPSDVDLLRQDLSTYRERDQKGVRAVAVEDEFRVPLMRHPRTGEIIYFRFKLDRLYERLDRPGHFIHVDYKSSKWAKSQQEVHQDPQMWAYNFGIIDFFPECVELEQVYDQLRHGVLHTRKTDAQRRQMREWLVRHVTAILNDESVQPDGLLKHRFNEWCAYCPILESCKVVEELTDYSLTRIAELAPVEPVLKKDGTPGKRTKPVELDEDRLPEYLETLDKAKAAKNVLDRFTEQVSGLVKELPLERRLAVGYEVSERSATVFGQDAKERLHAALGPRFYDMVKITKTGLESALGEDPELLRWALQLGDRQVGATIVSQAKAA